MPQNNNSSNSLSTSTNNNFFHSAKSNHLPANAKNKTNSPSISTNNNTFYSAKSRNERTNLNVLPPNVKENILHKATKSTSKVEDIPRGRLISEKASMVLGKNKNNIILVRAIHPTNDFWDSYYIFAGKYVKIDILHREINDSLLYIKEITLIGVKSTNYKLPKLYINFSFYWYDDNHNQYLVLIDVIISNDMRNYDSNMVNKEIRKMLQSFFDFTNNLSFNSFFEKSQKMFDNDSNIRKKLKKINQEIKNGNIYLSMKHNKSSELEFMIAQKMFELAHQYGNKNIVFHKLAHGGKVKTNMFNHQIEGAEKAREEQQENEEKWRKDIEQLEKYREKEQRKMYSKPPSKNTNNRNTKKQ